MSTERVHNVLPLPCRDAAQASSGQVTGDSREGVEGAAAAAVSVPGRTVPRDDDAHRDPLHIPNLGRRTRRGASCISLLKKVCPLFLFLHRCSRSALAARRSSTRHRAMRSTRTSRRGTGRCPATSRASAPPSRRKQAGAPCPTRTAKPAGRTGSRASGCAPIVATQCRVYRAWPLDSI